MELTETKPNHYKFTHKEKDFKLRIWEKEKDDWLDPYPEFSHSATLECKEFRGDFHLTKDCLNDVFIAPYHIELMVDALIKRYANR